MVGKLAVVWLLIAALFVVAAVDGVSIVITRFHLSDVATAASDAMRATTGSSHDVAKACATWPRHRRRPQDADLKVGKGFCVGRPHHERRHDHAARRGEDHPGGSPRRHEALRDGDRQGDHRPARRVASVRDRPGSDGAPRPPMPARVTRPRSANSWSGTRPASTTCACASWANREDARDAAQETFMAAMRKLGQFRGDAAFTTWLHRVAVNACYDELRKQRSDAHAPRIVPEATTTVRASPARPRRPRRRDRRDDGRGRRARRDPRGVPRRAGPGRRAGPAVRGDRPHPRRPVGHREVPGPPGPHRARRRDARGRLGGTDRRPRTSEEES